MPTGTQCVHAELAQVFRVGFCSVLLFTKVLVAQLVIAKEVDENLSAPLSTGCVCAAVDIRTSSSRGA